MKERTIINVAAFIIPTILTILIYKHDEIVYRIFYAFPIGVFFYELISHITEGADEKFKKNAPVSKKVSLLTFIIVFPISCYLSLDYCKTRIDDDVLLALASLAIGITIAEFFKGFVKYTINMFEKKE